MMMMEFPQSVSEGWAQLNHIRTQIRQLEGHKKMLEGYLQEQLGDDCIDGFYVNRWVVPAISYKSVLEELKVRLPDMRGTIDSLVEENTKLTQRAQVTQAEGSDGTEG